MTKPSSSTSPDSLTDLAAIRSEVFRSCQTVIVKIGSNVLTRDDDQLAPARIQQLAEQIDRLAKTGRKVIIVSSGAVAAGVGILGLSRKPQSLPELQAAAAAGQTHLMEGWRQALQGKGHQVAQLLLTIDDFRHRTRYLNVRNTIRTLFDFGLIPIINENDSISVDEIALGDNDQLASMIASLVARPLLIILSSIDGLFDGDPTSQNSKLIPIVETPGEFLLSHVADQQSSRGRGGMEAKLKAILNATSTGESVILANGQAENILDKIAAGESEGTLFLASGTTVPAWKRWIGLAGKPEGRLFLDEGACKALVEKGRSLLAVGIQQVTGTFEQGASVDIVGETAGVIARGLVNYSSEEIQRIAGKKSQQIPEVLGHVPYSEVVHRDNLVLVDAL